MKTQHPYYLPEYAVFAEGRQLKIFSSEQDALEFYNRLLDNGRDPVLVKRELIDDAPLHTPPAVA
ncbi:MAG: hypothetical protein Q4D06_10055 [Coriobacteriia bacterium]|nr:hypothetical protein [Coriobacteriia bacterium]